MEPSRPSHIDPAVFWPAMFIILGFVGWGTVFPESLSSISKVVLDAIISGFGWGFVVSSAGFLVSGAAAGDQNDFPFDIGRHLVYQDENLELKPGLATSWRPLSDTQWEFKLRENVRFHDGSAFDADDVVYTIERIRDVLKPPSGGFRSYVSGIKSVSAPDPLTVLIETNGAVPNLPLSFSSIFVMNRPSEGFVTTEDLNAGRPPVGTGPYRFERWSSGESLRLARNDDYWGGEPVWSKVTFRVIENPAARVAALSTGEVDVADAIPARDVASLEQRGAKIASVGAARVNFVQFDVARETLPGVTDKSGEPIANPFKNPLVRRALALATDRGILVDKILAGYGTAAAQVFPNSLPGTSAKLLPEAPNYEEAKTLLSKAGFPDGFNLVLAGPAGRYPGDAESLQAIAQSWAHGSHGLARRLARQLAITPAANNIATSSNVMRQPVFPSTSANRPGEGTSLVALGPAFVQRLLA
ncbi:peptide/nickel transport system substrate-binding protein (plasmid) [Ensifer sp. WSM1721]